VYCLKYDKEDPNVVYTGGWDYRVVVWDLRDRKPKKNGKTIMTSPLFG